MVDRLIEEFVSEAWETFVLVMVMLEGREDEYWPEAYIMEHYAELQNEFAEWFTLNLQNYFENKDSGLSTLIGDFIEYAAQFNLADEFLDELKTLI